MTQDHEGEGGPVYQTFVFCHRSERDARRVFNAIKSRWSFRGENPRVRTWLTVWSDGDLASPMDAVRMALDCRALDSMEQKELASDLLECTSWAQCRAKFAEWDLEESEGALIDARDAQPSPPPSNKEV